MFDLVGVANALSPYLPATAAAAIFLFVLKEIIEFFRRRGSDARKLSAIKHLLAREVELNAWSVRSYRFFLGALEEAERGQHIKVYNSEANRMHFEHWGEGDEPMHSRGMIPPVHTEVLSKHILDIATLDRNLLKETEHAASAVADLAHIRASTIEQVVNPKDRGGYIEYARSELDKIEDALEALYRKCTGKSEINRRIR